MGTGAANGEVRAGVVTKPGAFAVESFWRTAEPSGLDSLTAALLSRRVSFAHADMNPDICESETRRASYALYITLDGGSARHFVSLSSRPPLRSNHLLACNARPNSLIDIFLVHVKAHFNIAN